MPLPPPEARPRHRRTSEHVASTPPPKTVRAARYQSVRDAYRTTTTLLTYDDNDGAR